MRSVIWLLLLTLPWGLAAGSEPLFDDAKRLRAEYPAWFKTSLLDLPEDLDEAKAAGKLGIMLYFGTEGCAYCYQFLKRSLGDPETVRRLRALFDVIGLEIFDDSDMVAPDGRSLSVNALAELQGVEFSPTLVFLDTEGRVLLRVTGYYAPERFRRLLAYFEGGSYRRRSFRDFAVRQQAPGAERGVGHRLIPDPLFVAPPFMLDRSQSAADRPLLVLFERNGCPACSQFHISVLADPGVRALLQGFELVRLDAEDRDAPVLTPGGRRTNPAAWAHDLELTSSPALVFFDRQGAQVLKTDGLVLRQRMINSLHFVLDKAYQQGMTYQRFARARAMAGADQ